MNAPYRSLEVDDGRLRIQFKQRADEILKLVDDIHLDKVVDPQFDQKQVCILGYMLACMSQLASHHVSNGQTYGNTMRNNQHQRRPGLRSRACFSDAERSR